MQASDYTRCPACHQKKVMIKRKPNGEDNYSCTKKGCEFYFFVDQSDQIDRTERRRWEAENKGEVGG